MKRTYLFLLACTISLSGCGTVSVQNGNATKTSGGPKVSVNVSGVKVTTFYGASLDTTRFGEVDAGWVAGQVAHRAVVAQASQRGSVSCSIATIVSSSVHENLSNEKGHWTEDWTVEFCGATYSVAVNASGKDSFFSSVKYDAGPAIVIDKPATSGRQTLAVGHRKQANNNTLQSRPLLSTSGPTLDEVYASLSRAEKAKVNRLSPSDRADYLALIKNESR